jgi:hypothetical protein
MCFFFRSLSFHPLSWESFGCLRYAPLSSCSHLLYLCWYLLGWPNTDVQFLQPFLLSCTLPYFAERILSPILRYLSFSSLFMENIKLFHLLMLACVSKLCACASLGSLTTRRQRSQLQQGPAYTSLSVHSNDVAHQNSAGRYVGAMTAFVPLWLLRVTGDVWCSRIVLPPTYNSSAIYFDIPYCAGLPGTAHWAFIRR